MSIKAFPAESWREQMLERPLPHSAESERAVLGALLLDGSLVREAVELLRPDDFYLQAHQHIFRAMTSLAERGQEINPILVGEELKREGWFEMVGSIAYISELSYGLPVTKSIAGYAKIIRDKSDRRQLIKVGNKIASDNRDEEIEIEAASERAVQMILEVGRESEAKHSSRLSFPELNQSALHGLAGDFVRLVEPHTEADPAALLVQFIAAFGNCVGRTPHFSVEADRHHGNLFAVIVGATASGRKGTSWGHVRRCFEAVDEEWARKCLVSGLSSGEGLIWAVRDPIEVCKPVKEGRHATGRYENLIADQGVSDKRLLVVESEFASVLRAQGREGNTLSAVIRQAWDDGNIRSLTKNSPARATNAHVSIIGHITADELQRCLGDVERFNGYVNRFLWVLSRRSKFLPEGGRAHEEDFAWILRRLSGAVGFARRRYQIHRSGEALALWREVYRDISSRPAGLFGAVTARAAPQVMRLAMLYALLDESEMIRRDHLEAALALWSYTEGSVRYLFGELTGDHIADEALKALREAGSAGLTRTEVNALFHGHRKREEIDHALALLAESGLAVNRPEGTQGRPAERWIAISYPAEKAEKAEEGCCSTRSEETFSAFSATP